VGSDLLARESRSQEKKKNNCTHEYEKKEEKVNQLKRSIEQFSVWGIIRPLTCWDIAQL
jgi:hypothetical protein